ncbi:hypothetical protein M513_07335 [Trichuris suis]|uniref:ubiquitinyl hydrolase 1 n=1 Tax=Trichuris suis TaxID=68888 RepID=A0A085M3L2_9BILA|nr:hypothetical protein M513_07335 [Trichuris suis]
MFTTSITGANSCVTNLDYFAIGAQRLMPLLGSSARLVVLNSCLATVDSTKDRHVYHEKQLLQLCAVHALNNLFQKAIYSKAQLDEICLRYGLTNFYSVLTLVCCRLTPSRLLNPHRSMLGLGDYDINVIQEALLKTGCSALWFDRRKNVDSVLTTDCIGFIVNVPSNWSLLGVPIPLWSNRHWVRTCLSNVFKKFPAFQYAIREIEGTYYNLDSKLSHAEAIGGRQQLLQFLSDLLQSGDVQLFTIVRRDSADSVGRRQSPDANDATFLKLMALRLLSALFSRACIPCMVWRCYWQRGETVAYAMIRMWLFRRSCQQCQILVLIMLLQGTGQENQVGSQSIEGAQSKMLSGSFCHSSTADAVSNRRCISGLFDVVIDNSQLREDLTKNELDSTAAQQLRHVRRKRFTEDDVNQEEIPSAYTFGTTLLAVSEDDVIFKFFFPRPLLSKYCNYNGHSKFMLNEQHVCLQSVAKLSELCESDKSLSGSFFFKNYRLLKSPSFLKGGEFSDHLYADSGKPFWSSTTNDSIAVKLLTRKDGQNDKAKRSDFPVVGEPFWDATNRVCRNVALKVSPKCQKFQKCLLVSKADFVIRIDANNSIDEAYVVVQTGDVSSSAGDFARHFSIRYDTAANAASFGYKLFSPLTIFSSQPNLDENTTEGEQRLSVPKPSPSGQCEQSNPHTVRFGQNTFASCFISLPEILNLTTCQRIQRVVSERLYVVPENLLISPYAQASVASKDNWIPILKSQKPSAECPAMLLLQEKIFENGRCRLVMDARMDIAYLRDYDHLNGTYRVVEATVSYGKVKKLPPLVEGAGVVGAKLNSRRYIVRMAVIFSDRTEIGERSYNIALPIFFNELYSLSFGAFS